MLNVQRHDCRPKCFTKGGEPCKTCKYNYPRQRYVEGHDVFPLLNVATDRWDQECFEEEDGRLSPYVTEWLLASGASMNIQFCTTAGFLSYIAKYITKPEPYGTLADNAALRERDGNASAQVRFLQARVVGAPEAVYRALGYPLRSSAPVVHLPTNPPERRMRALLQHSERERQRKQRAREPVTDADFELRFADGPEQIYAARPRNELFDNMLYPDFHSKYEWRKFKKLTQAQRNAGEGNVGGFWRLDGEPALDGLDDDDDAVEKYKDVRCVVERREERAVAVVWRLPDQHGPLFYYQKLLLNVPWRDATPESFITPDNPRGSLAEQCRITTRADGVTTILPDGDEAEIARREAEARLFSPEQVRAIVERTTEHQATMDAMLALMADEEEEDDDVDGNDGGGCAAGGVLAAGVGDGTDEQLRADARRMVDEINQARGAPAYMPPPILQPTASSGLVWRDVNRPGATGVAFELKRAQIEAYELLKFASSKQIRAYLSGEGGMGKSTLINLLVQLWRSQGKRVIVTGASAKAAVSRAHPFRSPTCVAHRSPLIHRSSSASLPSAAAPHRGLHRALRVLAPEVRPLLRRADRQQEE